MFKKNIFQILISKFSLFLIFFYFHLGAAETSGLFPSLDLIAPSPLPKYFRIPSNQFSSQNTTFNNSDTLRLSASGQFTGTSFILMLNKVPAKKIIVVDLREESHGFINGIPISWKLPKTTWTNVNKTPEQIEEDEKIRLKNLADANYVLLDPQFEPLKLPVSHTSTEREFIEELGLSYMRLPITENHPPSDFMVDRIIELFLTLPEDSWIHAHCNGGRGRTTTFLSLADILANAKNSSLQEILHRQNLQEGTDLMRTHVPFDKRHVPAFERLAFLKLFHEYVANNDLTKITWSQWIKQNRLGKLQSF